VLKLVLKGVIGACLAAGILPARAAQAASEPRAVVFRQALLRFPDGRRIRVDIAGNPREWYDIGLTGRKSLPKNYGMLFVFPGMKFRGFWMWHTWVGLDMIFIDAHKRIVRIARNMKPWTPGMTKAQTAKSGAVCQYVLEVPAGTSAREKLSPGQTLRFSAPIPGR